MKTITNLYNEADIVFVKICNEATARRFIEDALKEGFTVNGYSKFKKPLLKHRVYWLYEGYEIRSISGYATHLFYYSGVSETDLKSIVRIDYAKYINSLDDYIITERKDL